MKKMSLITGLLTCALALQACSDSSATSPLLEALEDHRGEATESDRIFLDFKEVYPDYDEFIIVCQDAFREMALEHAGLPEDSVDQLGETESAILAYSSNDQSDVFADVVDNTDVTLCEGVHDSAVPITQNLQPFSYSEEFRSPAGSPWLRQGLDEALY